MNYGIAYPKVFKVITTKNYSHALAWAVSLESTGVFNYQDETVLGDNKIFFRQWNFSKQEDAVLFALKFK